MTRIPQRPPVGAYRESIRKAGLVYLKSGMVLIALRPWDKRPLANGWSKDRNAQIHTVEDLDAVMANNEVIGLGLHCEASKVLAVDFDIRYKDEAIPRDQFDRWLVANESMRSRLLSDPATNKAVVHSTTEDDYKIEVDGFGYTVGGRHHLFSNPAGLRNTSATPPLIDTRGDGGYIVLPPTAIKRPEKEGGTWHRYNVITYPQNYAALPEYPQWLADITHPKKTTKAKNLADATPRQQQAEALGLAKMTDVTPNSSVALNDPEIAYNKAVSNGRIGNRNDTGFWLACQLRDGGLASPDALKIMERYQKAVTTDSDQYTAEEAIASLNEAYSTAKREPARYQGQRRTIGHLGNNAVIIDGNVTPRPATLDPSYDAKLFNTLPLTDSGNADRFIASTRGNVAYNESMKKWMVWTGQQWEATDGNRIASFGRRVAEYIQVEADSVTSSCDVDTKDGQGLIKVWQRHATASQSKQRIDAMIDLSRGDIGTMATDYDTHLDYLPCGNGVIDLRDGTLLQHSRELRYTKITHIEYDATATCPQWLRFLDTITGGDNDLTRYLQIQVGYSLTGQTDQQALIFLYGNGANGKSTFMNTVAKLAGQYHTKINMDGIIDTENKGGASPHLVALHGMRLTSGSEFPAGKRINESMIKDLTGGDEITARGLYADPFTFRPINKFWLMGNHKPRITGTDNGIWRRLILIPFEHTIPEADRMPSSVIEAMFDKEMAGILTWAVQGAIAWYEHKQRASLPKPEAVANAITEYRQEEDMLARFTSEECDVYTGLDCTTKEMLEAFHTWLEDQGERVNAWSQTRLTRELKRIGIIQSTDRRKYLGIRPRPQGNVTD